MTATVFPLLDIPKAKPRKMIIGTKYASSPNIPNIALLIPVAAAPRITPITHKNVKIAAANITMSITSFFTAISTFFLDALDDVFLFLVLEDAFLVPFDVFVLPLDVLFPDADAIILLPSNSHKLFCIPTDTSFTKYYSIFFSACHVNIAGTFTNCNSSAFGFLFG